MNYDKGLKIIAVIIAIILGAFNIIGIIHAYNVSTTLATKVVEVVCYIITDLLSIFIYLSSK